MILKNTHSYDSPDYSKEFLILKNGRNISNIGNSSDNGEDKDDGYWNDSPSEKESGSNEGWVFVGDDSDNSTTDENNNLQVAVIKKKYWIQIMC